MITRKEHLAWAKQRAMEYVNAGDLLNAVSSMISDLGKHPDTVSSTNPMLSMLGMMEAQRGSAAVRHWIEGFM